MRIINTKNYLEIKLSSWEKLWGLHGDFKIPAKNIVSIEKGEPETGWFDLKFPGTFLPGVIKAGTYLTKRGKEYWYWTKYSKFTYIIELKEESYKRLILGTSKLI